MSEEENIEEQSTNNSLRSTEVINDQTSTNMAEYLLEFLIIFCCVSWFY